MHVDHNVFVPPDDTNATIWRYMDFARFVWLLEREALFFSRADRLGDAWEGALPDLNWLARETFHRQAEAESGQPWTWAPGIDPEAPTLTTTVLSTYVNCWNISDHENALLWSIYGKGVALESTYASLRDSLTCEESVYIGRVRYIDYGRETIPADNSYHPLVHKRLYFAAESELRAIIPGNPHGPDFRWVPDPRIGIAASVDLGKLIKAIHVAPGADLLHEVVSAVGDRYSIRAPVYQSSLDLPPKF